MIKLIELFAGIGTQAMALRNIGAEFERYRVVEFDKHAIKSYNAIHGTNFETLDIKNVKGSDLGIVEDDNTYVMTYSFPCQALSLAGRQGGMTEGSGTTSSLLWEVKRLLTECDRLPDVLVMENVPQVHSKKHIANFEKWIKFLEDLGYTNKWQDLNAKDFGVAQSRRRCFMVSMLNWKYKFPEGFELSKTMQDYLEEEVPEKYYLKKDKMEELIDKLVVGAKKECVCLNSKGGRGGVEGLQPSVQDRVYDPQGLSTAITTSFRPSIIEVKQATKKGTIDCKIGGVADLSYPNSENRRGRVIDGGDTCPTLTTGNQSLYILEDDKDDEVYRIRIRKLMPIECWRLMGCSDEDFNKAVAAGVSESQLYKQAGNAIVVDVLENLFKQLN